MNKIATALLLTVMSAGGLMATSNMSFASVRHSGRTISHKKVSEKKGKKTVKALEASYKTARRTPGEKKIRHRGRKGGKGRTSPAPTPIIG